MDLDHLLGKVNTYPKAPLLRRPLPPLETPKGPASQQTPPAATPAEPPGGGYPAN